MNKLNSLISKFLEVLTFVVFVVLVLGAIFTVEQNHAQAQFSQNSPEHEELVKIRRILEEIKSQGINCR